MNPVMDYCCFSENEKTNTNRTSFAVIKMNTVAFCQKNHEEHAEHTEDSCELHEPEEEETYVPVLLQLIDTRVMGTFKLYWQTHVRTQNASALSSCGHWLLAISRLSPILHWRLGPELRQEGKLGQWLSGSRPHRRIMLEIGPDPPSHSARWKNTQDPTDMSSISNTSQKKGEGRGGVVRAPERETGTTVDWGSLLSLHIRPLAGLASLFSFPASSHAGCQCAALQKQFLSVSLDHFLQSLPGCSVCIILSRIQTERIFRHQSYWAVSG